MLCTYRKAVAGSLILSGEGGTNSLDFRYATGLLPRSMTSVLLVLRATMSLPFAPSWFPCCYVHEVSAQMRRKLAMIYLAFCGVA
jgi:hypothetical protein